MRSKKIFPEMSSVKTMLIIVTFVLLTGCSPITFFSSGVASFDTASQERGLGGFVADTEIETRLGVVFFRHHYATYHRLNVNVYEGRVLLTGVLEKEEMREDAVRLAWQVSGVKAVIDEIKIGPKRTVGEFAVDKWIVSKINGHLFIEHKVRSRNYEVISVKGTVYLIGLASDQGELDHVLKIAQMTKGVKKVVSYVRLMTQNERRRQYLLAQENAEDTPLKRRKIVKESSKKPESREYGWAQKNSLPEQNKPQIAKKKAIAEPL